MFGCVSELGCRFADSVFDVRAADFVGRSRDSLAVPTHGRVRHVSGMQLIDSLSLD
jgi:hypothetical protein